MLRRAILIICVVGLVAVTLSATSRTATEPAPAMVESPPSTTPSPSPSPSPEPTAPVNDSEAEYLAKMVWGEARGLTTTEQAACVWCVLNRVDAGYGTIIEVVTAKNQFVGYRPGNPVDETILKLCEDVLLRWEIEAACVGEVGRVLPAEYLYFSGDGRHNYFRDSYTGGNIWSWTLHSPYEN